MSIVLSYGLRACPWGLENPGERELRPLLPGDPSRISMAATLDGHCGCGSESGAGNCPLAGDFPRGCATGAPTPPFYSPPRRGCRYYLWSFPPLLPIFTPPCGGEGSFDIPPPTHKEAPERKEHPVCVCVDFGGGVVRRSGKRSSHNNTTMDECYRNSHTRLVTFFLVEFFCSF